MKNSLIKEKIEELILSTGVSFDEIEIVFDEDTKNDRFVIKTKEPYVLIGKEGEILSALNYLMKQIAMANSTLEEPYSPFTLDVNDYKAKKDAELKTKALMLAERARFFKSSIEMSPMNPYERMVIHSIFSETPDIQTESTGMGPSRRIVIKYAISEPKEME